MPSIFHSIHFCSVLMKCEFLLYVFCNPIHRNLVFTWTKQHVLTHFVYLCRSLSLFECNWNLRKSNVRTFYALPAEWQVRFQFGAIGWPYFDLQLTVAVLKDPDSRNEQQTILSRLLIVSVLLNVHKLLQKQILQLAVFLLLIVGAVCQGVLGLLTAIKSLLPYCKYIVYLYTCYLSWHVFPL